jgi:hypothetical protein
MQNYPFDAKYTFVLNLFSDIERLASLNESYLEPQVEEYMPRVRTNMSISSIWLDKVGRDI